jgi:hypothetical protein
LISAEAHELYKNITDLFAYQSELPDRLVGKLRRASQLAAQVVVESTLSDEDMEWFLSILRQAVAAGLKSSDLADAIRYSKSEEANDINGSGLPAQIEYLVQSGQGFRVLELL